MPLEGSALWFLAALTAAAFANGIWRVLGVLVAARIDESGALFAWARMVATALVAALIGQLIFAPAGVFAEAPLWLRVGSLVAGCLAYWFARRSIAVGILVGEAVLIGIMLLR